MVLGMVVLGYRFDWTRNRGDNRSFVVIVKILTWRRYRWRWSYNRIVLFFILDCGLAISFYRSHRLSIIWIYPPMIPYMIWIIPHPHRIIQSILSPTFVSKSMYLGEGSLQSNFKIFAQICRRNWKFLFFSSFFKYRYIEMKKKSRFFKIFSRIWLKNLNKHFQD